MKESSKEFLTGIIPNLRALVSGSIDDIVEDSSVLAFEDHNVIVDLYTAYSEYEIDSFNQIIDATNEFFEFLQNSEPYKTSGFVRDTINRARRIVNRHIHRFAYESLNNKFALTALNLSPTNPKNSHILDVGPGFVPYSSLSLASEAEQVSAMDEDFLFSIKCLKNMNVNAFKTYFGKNTSIDEYDFVVGSCPCSAIPYIVAKCKSANKPYFLRLCDCALYDKRVSILNSFADVGIHSWKIILPNLDPHIKFYDDYAFNVGASPEQVKKVISSVYEKQPSENKSVTLPKQLILDISEPDISIVDKDLSNTTWQVEKS